MKGGWNAVSRRAGGGDEGLMKMRVLQRAWEGEKKHIDLLVEEEIGDFK